MEHTFTVKGQRRYRYCVGAMAIRFDELPRDGVVADQAELACLGYVTAPD